MLAREVVLIFIVDVPEPVMDVGVKLTVTPDGWPDADRAMEELKPFSALVEIVELLELPLTTVTVVGDAEMEKSAAGAVTVKVTVAVRVMLSPVPVTVIGYVPAAVLEPTAMVIVELPEPGAAMEAGLKLTVTPLGCPDADNEMAELKPPEMVVEIEDVPLFPCSTESEAGEAEMAKLGADDVPARAPISAAPFGLPQPVAKS